MASYYFSYNGVNLSNLVSVRAVETTVLPSRENHAITIWERTGSIYNSYRYGERDIVVKFLIRATKQEYNSNNDIMENKLNVLRNTFKVTEPKPLYLGAKTRYIYAVPEGDFKMTELRYDCYECEIQFVCHNPEYYSASVKASNNRASTYGMRNLSNNGNTIEVYNGGNASAYPIINIGINDTTSFVQVENTTNGNKFLLGSYPKAGMYTMTQSDTILNDDMTDQSWHAAPPIINGNQCLDSNRDYRGQVKHTYDGSGIMIATPANDNPSYLWHGIGSSKTLSTSLENFEVRAKLHLNSYGVGGDPTYPKLRDEGDRYNNNGIKEYFYKVVAPSVSIKSDKSISSDTVGTYNKGDYVFPISSTIDNGWLQVEGGYCEAVYLKKYVADSTMTEAAMNVVTKDEIGLWSRPSNDPSESILLATIDAGTPLRVGSLEGDYYKLYIPYNGKVGYIDESMVKGYDDITVEYPVEEIIVSDDNKTGICEVYGYSETGTRLFKLCLSDENQYYSFVTPTVYVGDNKVLEDITTVSSNNKVNIDEYNVAYDALSESSCDWNEFFGEFGIRRVDNKWQAWIYKIEDGVTVKKLILKEQEISGASTESLYYIIIYMGAQDPSNMCGMSITDIQVERINDAASSDCNIAPFKSGDEIKIDCYNSKVYLNNKPYNDIDMNSQFIELLTGNNILKATSNNSNMLVTVLFNERYL